MKRICDWLRTLNNPRSITTVFLTALISLSLLALRSSQFAVSAPDANLHYDSQHLEDFFCVDPGGYLSIHQLRLLYIVTQLSLDTVLPLSYGTLIGILIVRVCPIGNATRLIVLPIMAAMLDLTENAMLVFLAATWKCGTEFPLLFEIVPWVTSAKWGLVLISTGVIVAGWMKAKRPKVT